MSKILITGNAGMIGSELADYFLEQGFEVVGIDDLSGGSVKNINPKVTFNQWSILSPGAIESIFAYEKPDYVIHCAAFAAECLSPFIRNYISQNIVVGTENIINACVNYDVKKIIHFSSIARYGEILTPFKEGDHPEPIDIYGICKLNNELSLREAYRHFGLEYSIVAPHNCLSPRQNFGDKYRNVAAIFIRKCIEGNDLQIFGDGLQRRCFTDAKQLCLPIHRLLTNYNEGLFNLGSDHSHTVLDLATIILNIGKTKGYNKSNIKFCEPRIEVKEAICSHSQAKAILNFWDDTNLEDLLERMFNEAIKQAPFKPYTKMDYEITKNMYSYWK